MSILHRSILGAVAAAGLALVASAPAHAQSGVRVGVLTCNVASGFGLIFGSSKEVNCVFSRDGRDLAHYQGHIDKFGVDIGYTAGGVMVWAVFAPTAGPPPGSLDGTYGGVTASATAGVGVGANLLVGGSDRSISLQPLSVEGNTGLNVAGGIAGLRLHYLP
ncbi:MAG TPA: DUF992 domain-containing protein [Caulobacteraceae bacterium]|jgi:hypothetical protein